MNGIDILLWSIAGLSIVGLVALPIAYWWRYGRGQ